MHGAGNDYIYVNTMMYTIEDPENFAKKWSCYRTGIGSDAILKLMAEKRKEFACEFINYYDLVRTNQYLSVLDTKQANSRYYGESGYGELRYASVNLRQNCLEKCIDGPNGVKVPLLPIPLSEVQSYGLTQNKGY